MPRALGPPAQAKRGAPGTLASASRPLQRRASSTSIAVHWPSPQASGLTHTLVPLPSFLLLLLVAPTPQAKTPPSSL